MTKKSQDSDVAFIQALAAILDENGMTEIQVKRIYANNDSMNVRVSRQTQMVAAAPVAVAPIAPAAAP
ncbi:MAG: acetyl-CoA carboxylase, biotin carboxyl carrier protein, partial [Marinosulfonomonas sp.]